MDDLKRHKHTVITHAIISFYYIWIIKILSHLFYVSNLATVLHFVLYQIFLLFSSKCVFLITFVHTFQECPKNHRQTLPNQSAFRTIFEVGMLHFVPQSFKSIFESNVCLLINHKERRFLNRVMLVSKNAVHFVFQHFCFIFVFSSQQPHTITFSKSHTPPKTTFPVVVPRDKTVNSQIEASWRSYPGDGVTRWPRCPPGTIITASMWPNCTSRGPAALNHRCLCFP